MQRFLRHRPRLIALAALAGMTVAPVAWADTFSIIASVPGSPLVGGIRNGTVFGTESYGGANGAGFVFSAQNGKYAVLYNFTGGSDGGNPNGGLEIDGNGNLYGASQSGGSALGGILFKLNPSKVLSVLHNFGVDNDGSYPQQGLVRTSTGTFYGATKAGTVTSNGNVFEVTKSGTYSMVHDFLSEGDGHCPFAGVARDAAGNIFGTTVGIGYGGNPNGSVWKIAPDGTLTTLYVFQDGADGEWPDEAPALDGAGNLYGTTHIQNGSGFAGAIWKIDTTGKFTVLYSLNGATDGSSPNAPLVLGGDGNLYGTAEYGALGYGTLFQITPSGTYTVKHTFTGGADGGSPTGALAVHGLSIFGGSAGAVFKYVP